MAPFDDIAHSGRIKDTEETFLDWTGRPTLFDEGEEPADEPAGEDSPEEEEEADD